MSTSGTDTSSSWSDVDFGKRVVHVGRSFAGSSFGAPKSQRWPQRPRPQHAV